MNSYVFLTVMICLDVLTGFILSSDTVQNQYHDYIYTKAQGYDELSDNMYTNLKQVEHASGEYSMDTTTGDTLGLSTNWLMAFNYGLNPFAFPSPTNVFEGYMVLAFVIYKMLITGYTVLLIVMLWKNKKTD